MDCPRTVDDLLKLVEKNDVVITNLKYKTYFTKLITGVKSLLKFVKGAENKFYMVDCIRSTSQGTERISKSLKGAQHAVFYFPPELALREKRMWRSRWKNTYLDDDQQVKYLMLASTATKINKGKLCLPDECIGEPIFLLHEAHLNTARRSRREEERRMAAATRRVFAKGKNDSKPKRSVLETRRKQYLKAAKKRKDHWMRRGGFMTTLADVASTFSSQEQNLQVVLPPKKLLRDKVSECPHHCGNRIILKKGMPFNSYIKCSKCEKKIRVRFYPKEKETVSL